MTPYKNEERVKQRIHDIVYSCDSRDELAERIVKLEELTRDMGKAFLVLDIDHCQCCPRDDACTFVCRSFGSKECAFKRDLHELGIENAYD